MALINKIKSIMQRLQLKKTLNILTGEILTSNVKHFS